MRRSISFVSYRLLFAAFLILAIGWSAFAGTFSAGATGEGTLIAWLAGLDFEGEIDGTIRLEGELAPDAGEAVPFCAEGTLRGFGVSGIVTALTEGWIGYKVEGHADNGEPIEIRGLLYTSRISVVPLQADAAFIGTHRARILFDGAAHAVFGEFSGSVRGAAEPADRPGTIQFGGSGTIGFDGETGVEATPIPLDHPALPAEFLRYLAELGFGA